MGNSARLRALPSPTLELLEEPPHLTDQEFRAYWPCCLTRYDLLQLPGGMPEALLLGTYRGTTNSNVVLRTVPLGLPITGLRINLKACRSVVAPPEHLRATRTFRRLRPRGCCTAGQSLADQLRGTDAPLAGLGHIPVLIAATTAAVLVIPLALIALGLGMAAALLALGLLGVGALGPRRHTLRAPSPEPTPQSDAPVS